MDADLGDGPVRYERIAEHIVTVTLSRPDRMNAIDVPMTHALVQCVRKAEADNGVRVVILTASGSRAFCAGADMAVITAGRMADIVTQDGDLAGFVRLKRSKPWIAAVNGLAYGGGLEMALACEIIIASNNSSFAAPEARIGWAATAGGAFRLSRLIPRSQAMEMLLTGAPISAQRAYEVGLIARLCKAEELTAEALKIALLIAANSPASVRETMLLVSASAGLPEEQMWKLSAEARERIMRGPDSVEGLHAKQEGRSPKWQ